MNPHTYLISFDTASAAEANRYADHLRTTLLDASPALLAERQRHDPTAQDAGQELLIHIITSPATDTIGGAMIGLLVTILTKWLTRHPTASLTFKRPEGDVIANNISSKTVVKLTKILLQDQETRKNT